MFGNKRKIKTTAYYVPAVSIQLFSSQTYFKEKKSGSLSITHDRSTLTLKDGSILDFPYLESTVHAHTRAFQSKSTNSGTYL
jgi:hypothetical protein